MSRLLETFYQRDNNTCFYGKCLYCKGPDTGVCADGHILEGVMLLWLPETLTLKRHKHPWSRVYKTQQPAQLVFLSTVQSHILEIWKFWWGFYFRETSHMKIKPSRNGKITLSFIDIGKSWHNCEFFTALKCLLLLFGKIKFSQKFLNLH